MEPQDLDAQIAQELTDRGYEATPEAIEKIKSKLGVSAPRGRTLQRFAAPSRPEPVVETPPAAPTEPPEESFGEKLGDAVDALQGGFAQITASGFRAADTAARKLSSTFAGVPYEQVRRGVGGYGGAFADAAEYFREVEEANRLSDEDEADYVNQVARGIGNAAGFSVASIAGGPGIGGLASIGAYGAATQSNDAYWRILDKTKDEEKAWQGASLNAIAGASEAFGAFIPGARALGSILFRMDKSTGGALKKALLPSMAGGMLKGGLAEGGQEMFQGSAEIAIDRYLDVYPEDRRTIMQVAKDVYETQGAPAFGVGAVLAPLGIAAERADMRARERARSVERVERPEGTEREMAPESAKFFEQLKSRGARRVVETPEEFKPQEEAARRRGLRLYAIETSAGSTVAGVERSGTGDIFININRRNEAIRGTIDHEVDHKLEVMDPEGYAAKAKIIEETEPELLQQKMLELKERYAREGIELSDENAKREAIAMLMETEVFPFTEAFRTDPKLVEEFLTDDRGAFKKVLEATMNVMNEMGAGFDTRRARLGKLLERVNAIEGKIKPESAARIAQEYVRSMQTLETLETGRAEAEQAAQRKAAEDRARARAEARAAVGREAAPTAAPTASVATESPAAPGAPKAPQVAPAPTPTDLISSDEAASLLGLSPSELVGLRDDGVLRSRGTDAEGRMMFSKAEVEAAMSALAGAAPTETAAAPTETAAAPEPRLTEAERESTLEPIRKEMQRRLDRERQARTEGAARAEAPFAEAQRQVDELTAAQEKLDAAAARRDAALNDLSNLRRQARGRVSFQPQLAEAQQRVIEAQREYVAAERESKAPRMAVEGTLLIGEDVTVKGVRGRVVDVTGPAGKQRVDVQFGETAPISDIPISFYNQPGGLPQQSRPGGTRGVYDIKNVQRVASERPAFERTPQQRRAFKEQFGGEAPRFSLTGARNITQRDRDYLSAVAAGDMETAQRMVDEAAKAAGFNETGDHGLALGELKGNAFDSRLRGSNTRSGSAYLGYFFGSEKTAKSYGQKTMGEMAYEVPGILRDILSPFPKLVPKGVSRDLDDIRYRSDQISDSAFGPGVNDVYEPYEFVTSSSEYAKRVLRDIASSAEWAELENYDQIQTAVDSAIERVENEIDTIDEDSTTNVSIFKALLKMSNPMVHDQKGERYREQTYYDIISKAKAEGHDSVIIRNTFDGGPLDDIKVVFEPSQIKSSELVTYDDAGNVIPLSQRFGPSSDVRYSMGARNITQRDRDYLSAVAAGDMETAQRMVDEAAKEAGFSTDEVFYHGTEADWNVYKDVGPSTTGGKWVRRDLKFMTAIFLSNNRDIAESYGSNVRGFYVNFGSEKYDSDPGIVEADGKNWAEVYGDVIDLLKYAAPSVIVRNVKDSAISSGPFGDATTSTVVVLTNNDDLKSADPVTRDNAGNVIPLSQRFGGSPDIRYSMGGFASFSDALDDVRKRGDIATQSFRTTFVDYLNETKKLLETATKLPYQKIEAMQRTLGRRGISGQRIRDEVTPRFNKLVDAMRSAGVDHADVADFMRARVQPIAEKVVKERRSKMDPTGTMYEAQITATEAADIMKRLKAQPNYNDIVRVVKMVDDVNQRALDINLASGKIDRDSYDKMMAQYDPAVQGMANPEGFKTFYGSLESMPERSVVDSALMDVPGIGRGVGRTGRPYRGRTGVLKGSDVELKSPVVNAFVGLQNAVIRGVKSEEQRSYAKLVKDLNDPTFAVIHETLPTEDVVGSDGYVHRVPKGDWAEQEGWLPYIENGKWKAIEFKGGNKLIAEDLKAKTVSAPLPGVAEVTRKVASLMTRLDPTFMLRNIPRDWGWAFLAGTSKYGTAFTKAMASEYKPALKDLWAVKRGGAPSGLLKQYLDAGAEISSMGFKNYEDNLADLEKSLSAKDPNLATKIQNTWESWVGETNDVLENATRYAAFRAAVREGKSVGEAMLVAKEGVALNFEQTGRVGRPINSAFAFFNAGVNGTDAIIRLLTKPGTEGARARRLAGSVVAMGFAAELLNRMVSEDGDDEVPVYDNISEFEKNRNFLFMRPDGSYFKVPIPFGFNAVYAFGRNMAAYMSGARSAMAAATDSVSFAMESASPFGSGPMLQVISPTLLDPIVQWKTNETFTGSKIAPDLEQFGRQTKAPHEIFWKNTADMPKEIAELVADVTEVGDSGRGFIDFRPDMLEHWASSYMGGVGRAAIDLSNTIGAAYKGEAPDAREAFAVRHFIGEASPYAIDKRYRDMRSEIEQVQARYKQLIEEGDRPTALRWRAANAQLFRASGTLKSIERALDKIPNTPENEERRRTIKARLVRQTGYTQE